MSSSTAEAYHKARQLIDDVHRQDPRYARRIEQVTAAHNADAADDEQDDGQDELAYADAMEQWVTTLLDRAGGQDVVAARLEALPGGRTLVCLAARCQHLERFATPRSTFPDGRAGYLQWRRSLYTKQADKAVELLKQAGVSDDESAHVRKWVSKTDLKPGKQGGEWGTQLLEDAAVLVFLQDQLHHFASQHAGYTREKFVDIIKKTWRKLSDEGKEAALGLQMSNPLKSIIEEAISDPALTRKATT